MFRLRSFMSPETFIERWQDGEGGQERANYALFLTELCDLIGVARPQPAGATHEHNDYVFERAVKQQHDGSDANRRIDLYKRNSFVLEAKQSRIRGKAKEVVEDAILPHLDIPQKSLGRRGADRGWDVLMLRAKAQAENYARSLPASHGWPPFVLVCDVGHCIEVYADFSGQGKNYTQFPDRQGFRIYLEDLRKDDVRERLRKIWDEPKSLDPAQASARVTRDIAQRLAQVSKALEAQNHSPERVAQFLMRCLFTMFAASVGLLDKDALTDLLALCRDKPNSFTPLLEELWHAMNKGAFSASIRADVLKFNGTLFDGAKALPLGREEIGELYEAARRNWRDVEPAIFGTLLEQALDPAERRRLGAHYTPRAYVERLVLATVIEPLREEWRNVLGTAERLRTAGDVKGAAATVQAFHDKLCRTRVLDPACGTGNFLYVSLELMKRLEGEVLEALLDLGGQESLRGLAGHTVDPHQFLGLEINTRAAAIAELVLWIGYLQWHFRTRGGIPDEPILRKFDNIKAMNAVLTWDGYPTPQFVDGKETYPNPRRPSWPQAEFIVGNPPFIGGKDIRARLGDAVAEALWKAHRHINESADFVMYWWDRAAEILVAKGSPLQRFGFVTTNSITQEFSRRVIKKRMEGKSPLSIVMAIADHPWTKATKDAAAVRIAMTVVDRGYRDGLMQEVIEERKLDTDQPEIEFRNKFGCVNPDLTIGVNVASVTPLMASDGLCSRGVSLHGAGFIVFRNEAEHLGLGKRAGLEKYIREYRNGRDLNGLPRNVLVIDLLGLDADDIRKRFPEVYQHVKAEVKEKIDISADGKEDYVGRDWNSRKSYRDNWWLFGEPRRELRPALERCSRYIATVETSKHRIFQFLSTSILPDNMIVAIALEDAFHLGILSSRIHCNWALRAGGWLGVGNDPRYSKSKVFDPFPFPSPSPLLKTKIRAVAQDLDDFRKQRQAEHPSLTLTQMYNVLEKLKAGEALNESEEQIKADGLILILKEFHERLDALVFEAYGWPQSLSDDEILEKLVALNKERAEEERRGHVRWLRPDYQIPRFGKILDKQAAKEEGAQIAAALDLAEKVQRPLFPADDVQQTAAVFSVLAAAQRPLDAGAIAAHFRRTRTTVPNIVRVLAALSRLGYVFSADGKTFTLHAATLRQAA